MISVNLPTRLWWEQMQQKVKKKKGRKKKDNKTKRVQASTVNFCTKGPNATVCSVPPEHTVTDFFYFRPS